MMMITEKLAHYFDDYDDLPLKKDFLQLATS
jgi:hypothetical protein